MFQAIHYTEFVLIHGVSILLVMQMMGYICISFLPALLPMALLFSVLMTYGRLSQDSFARDLFGNFDFTIFSTNQFQHRSLGKSPI
jgi:hypothetical protein